MLVGAGELISGMVAGFFAALSRSRGLATEEERKAELSRAAWWSDANERKNLGFYAEFHRGKWHFPDDMTEVEFTRAFEEADHVLQLAEGMVDETNRNTELS